VVHAHNRPEYAFVFHFGGGGCTVCRKFVKDEMRWLWRNPAANLSPLSFQNSLMSIAAFAAGSKLACGHSV
jgi:hypothetical protein